MKRTLACLLAVLTLCVSFSACASSTQEAITCNLGGELERVKLRAEPSAHAALQGQYFANVRVQVVENSGKWSRVKIGDREGYMMSRFLTDKIPEVFTEGVTGMPCGQDALPVYAQADPGAAKIATVTGDSFHVLATTGESWLQVRLNAASGEQPVTGYVLSADVCMTGNRQTVLADTGKASKMIKLCDSTGKHPKTLGQYFNGAVFYRLFDNHSNNDGWTRVRIGDAAGYVKTAELDDSGSGVGRFRAPLSKTKVESIPLFAQAKSEQAVDSVTNKAVFAVLGEEADRYYLMIQTDDSAQCRYGYARKADMIAVHRSVDASGTLIGKQTLYDQDSDGKMQPIDATAPANAKVTVLGVAGGLANAFPYIDPDAKWLACLVKTGAKKNTYAILPRSGVRFNAALIYRKP